MNSTLNHLTAGIFLIALSTGFGQSTIQFSAVTYTVAESTGSVSLTVLRTGNTNTEVSVDYATADGNAAALPPVSSARWSSVAITAAYQACAQLHA